MYRACTVRVGHIDALILSRGLKEIFYVSSSSLGMSNHNSCSGPVTYMGYLLTSPTLAYLSLYRTQLTPIYACNNYRWTRLTTILGSYSGVKLITHL